MNKRSYLTAMALFTALVFLPSAATESAAESIKGRDKTADIMKLMKIRGEDKLPEQIMAEVIPQLKKMAGSTPDSFWDEAKSKVDQQALLDKIAAIYDEEMSHEHIIATLDFYETPAGKQLVEAMPAVAVGAMKESRRWGNDVATDIFMLLADEGYVSPDAGRGAH